MEDDPKVEKSAVEAIGNRKLMTQTHSSMQVTKTTQSGFSS